MAKSKRPISPGHAKLNGIAQSAGEFAFVPPPALVPALHGGLTALICFGGFLGMSGFELMEWGLFAYAPAQGGLLALWLIFGRGLFVIRLAALVAAVTIWTLWVGSIVVYDARKPTPFDTMVPVVVIVTLVFLGFAFAGWRLIRLGEESDGRGVTEIGRWQFKLRNLASMLLIASVAFASYRWWKPLLLTSAALQILNGLEAVSILFAVRMMLANHTIRWLLAIYYTLTFAVTCVLCIADSHAQDIVPMFLIVMVPAMSIVPLSLWPYRLAGYRLMRCTG
jgi:hypothetical protein